MDWLSVIFVAWAIFTLAYGVARLTNDYSVVDIFWGLSLIAIGHVVLEFSGDHGLAKWVYLLIVVWGLRLSMHIMARKLLWPGEDFRYQALRKSWSNVSRPYITVFMFQALLAIIIALPLILLAQDEAASLGVWAIFGSLIAIVGLALEAVADYQLMIFKKSHLNEKSLRCEEGVWGLSRHPNYLGEILFWTGLAIVALSAQYGWYAFISPILLGFLLVKVTGAPLVDKHMEDYQSQQKDIPLLLPKPKALIDYLKSCCKK